MPPARAPDRPLSKASRAAPRVAPTEARDLRYSSELQGKPISRITAGWDTTYLKLVSTHSTPPNDLGTQHVVLELMMRVRISMCGPHIEIGQQEGVFGDYPTVAGRFRGYALSAPSASRGETRATTARRCCLAAKTKITPLTENAGR